MFLVLWVVVMDWESAMANLDSKEKKQPQKWLSDVCTVSATPQIDIYSIVGASLRRRVSKPETQKIW